ncbi:hypothetical protein BTO13_11435 [Polaribacter gangjinensis]|uniref:Uncharacterized protein n=1 Tax=Polaribacter gangjinensis TaxID=574710 RepID=A0A2S7WDY0_9FLAO|nr:hypothetical protein BTO13_11435 [Polaribacter gangjinensis]
MNNFFFTTFALRKRIYCVMKRILQILKIIQLFIFLPFEISNGSKRRAYIRIKKMMIAANLL